MSVHVRFRVAAEAYAMPVEHVIEVADVGDLAPVPGAPSAVLGVRNLRGQILPVVDLAALLGIGPATDPQHLLVVEAGGSTAGFAIDEVSDVGMLPEPAEDTESRLLAGAALVDDVLVGVIDVPRVFEALEQREQ